MLLCFRAMCSLSPFSHRPLLLPLFQRTRQFSTALTCETTVRVKTTTMASLGSPVTSLRRNNKGETEALVSLKGAADAAGEENEVKVLMEEEESAL